MAVSYTHLERQEKKALEAQQDSVSYVQAINALKNGSFVPYKIH